MFYLIFEGHMVASNCLHPLHLNLSGWLSHWQSYNISLFISLFWKIDSQEFSICYYGRSLKVGFLIIILSYNEWIHSRMNNKL